MKFYTALAVTLLCTAALLLVGCAATGGKAPLDPKKADAVVQVKGMSCPQCGNNIKLLMDDEDEIRDSRVDLGEGQVFIAFETGQTLSADQIKDLVDRAGFTPGDVEFLKKGDK